MTPYELTRHALNYQVFYVLHRVGLAWLIIELALSLFKGFAAVIFLKNFLGVRPGAKCRKSALAVCSLAYALILWAEYYFFGWFRLWGLAIVFLPLLCVLLAYSLAFCGGRTREKILAPLCANAINLSVTLLSNLMSLELRGKMAELHGAYGLYNIYETWAVLFISPALIYFVFYLILRLFGRCDFSRKSSLIQWTVLSAALTVSIISAVHIFIRFDFRADNLVRLRTFGGVIIMSFLLSDIFVFLLLGDIMRKNKAVTELALLRRTEEYNRQYIASLKNEYETVRKLRHDSKNCLLAVSSLIERGETERAKEQIESYLGEMSTSEVFIETDNSVVNAVVNAKLTAAKSAGIECECMVCRDICGIADHDLCRLLSNMLDNAIEACELDPSPCRLIELRITREGESCTFAVKNTVPSPVLETNPELKSTKSDPSEHGCGVRIIREIAEKYSGRSDFYDEDGMFVARVRMEGRG